MTLAPVLTQCHVCRSPVAEAINRKLVAGEPYVGISKWLRDMGGDLYLSRQALARHKEQHLTTEFERQRQDAVESLERQSRKIKTKSGDLAQLVRDNVLARVEDGELSPSLADGLRAQQMLDARAAKETDRDIALVFAQVLGGAMLPAPAAVAALPAPSIEGEFEELPDG